MPALSEVELGSHSATEPLPNDLSKRVLNVGHQGMPSYLVDLLDEKILSASTDGTTVVVMQFIRGHHDSPFAKNWKKHQGWQGDESIRQLIRYRFKIGVTQEIKTRELDVSARNFVFG